MSAYQLFSDATLDLPHTTIEELDIQVIPMHFDLAENSYRHFEDERELSLEEIEEIRARTPAALELEAHDGQYDLKTAAILRTARVIMDGQVYVRKSRIQ